jgi:hypothetical protein
MIKKALLLCSFFACNLEAMRVPSDKIPLFKIKSDRGLRNPMSEDDVARILPAERCGPEGTIETLVTLLEHGLIRKEKSLKLTYDGVEEDEDFSVTLMRADVSDALGGAVVPGDHIHVLGIDLGIRSFKVGDLIVIKDPKNAAIKTILLKTYIEHLADTTIVDLCGQRAFDVLNAEGEYALGFDYKANPVHGIRDRLRGVKLAVLKEGVVAVGDRVVICSIPGNEIILQQHGLNSSYQELLAQSRPVGEAAMKQYDAEKLKRIHEVQNKKQKGYCAEVGVEGFLAVFAALGGIAFYPSWYLLG